MFGSMQCRLGSFMKPDLRTLVISAAAIGLSGVLMAAPAIAHHKEGHNAGGGGGGDDGGGDATYQIRITNEDDPIDPIAAGRGVEGPGGTIDGIVGAGDFESIALASIPTDGSITADANVKEDYNALCDYVNPLHESEAIDDIRVVHDFEIDTITVPVDYTVTNDETGETQSFTLLLQGPYSGEFPPTEIVGLTIWNNRGGGKGKNNRCGTGPRGLAVDLQGLAVVTLEIVEEP